MRMLPLILSATVASVAPAALFAEDIPLRAEVRAVTLYPSGGTVTREATFSAPQGEHELILLDLPRDTDLDSVRVAVEGAAMGTLTTRRDYVPPRDPAKGEAIEAAEAEVERLEEALRGARAEIEGVRLEQEAAEARVAFLAALGQGDGVAQMEPAALRELIGLVGDETLSAKQAAQAARLRAEAAERDLKDLTEDLQAAREALAALVPQEGPHAMLAVAIEADAATEGRITLSYNVHQAGWQPVYDMRLDRQSGQLEIARGAYVSQASGENWQSVDLILSTVRPVEQTEPSEVHPWQRWITDKDAPQPVLKTLRGAAADDFARAEMAAEPAPAIVAEAEFDGLSVSYRYNRPLSLASGADRVRIDLGTLETTTETYARAVPLADSSAFLMADMTNDTGEMILPGMVMKYLDGKFVGRGYSELVPAGAEADISFGPIDGLRLTRRIEDRQEGDRGVIRKSNDMNEAVRIEVENLTGEDWPVRLRDRVPYSEQEQLEITWEAAPRVSESDLDGQRGVLEWHFDLAAGETKVVKLDQWLKWPEDKVLR
ncbi:DUF4139 domain-containing protein [Roseovarius nubinhibens]